MGQEEEKEKVVYVEANPDNNDKEKKLTRIYLIVGGALLLSVIIVLCLAFIPPLFQKNSSSEPTSSEYQVSDNTPTIYNNLLTYVNNRRSALSIDPASSLTSFEYKDGSVEVTYVCNDYPGYMKLDDVGLSNGSEFLSLFIDKVPTNDYPSTITNETFGENVTINLGDLNASTKTSKLGVSTYVSLIAEKDDSTIYCLCHKEYESDHIYDNYVSVNKSDDPVLYDFYYYTLNK